jgi:hypothetical protein
LGATQPSHGPTTDIELEPRIIVFRLFSVTGRPGRIRDCGVPKRFNMLIPTDISRILSSSFTPDVIRNQSSTRLGCTCIENYTLTPSTPVFVKGVCQSQPKMNQPFRCLSSQYGQKFTATLSKLIPLSRESSGFQSGVRTDTGYSTHLHYPAKLLAETRLCE